MIDGEFTVKRFWKYGEKLFLEAANPEFASIQIGENQELDHLEGLSPTSPTRLDEAEAVFKRHITKHGESGFFLTNLAKVYANRGDNAETENILWHSLEMDSNQDNGLAWFYAIHNERGGEPFDALRRPAQLPSSWLARSELKNRNLVGALDFYREALSRMNPVLADALMQISGERIAQGYTLICES